MADANLSGIYSRLNGVTPYHPFEADTFADWTLEAGDIVTVSRDGTSYSSPVSSTTLKWNGQHTMSIHSTGEREREPIAKTSKRKYASHGGGMTNNQELYWEVMSEDGMLGSTLRMTASQIRSDVFAANSMLYSYIDQTATYIISHVEDVQNELGSEILQTASQIRSEVHATASQLYSYIDQTATYIESHVEDVANDLGSQILQTASQIYTAVYAANSQLYSYVDQTATYISSHVDDVQNDLHSEILQTQSMIRSAVWTANSMVYSYIDQTATYIISVVEDTANDLGSQILQTASQIYSSVYAANSQLYSYIDQTATYISSHVDDVQNDLHSEILQTQSMIRSAVWTANSMVYSYIDQTATYIVSVVEDVNNDLGSQILQTASQIYSTVYATSSTLYSYIDQTATYIESVVADTANDLGSQILQTASQIYSSVYAANSTIYSYIDQTATSINQAVVDTVSGMQSQITQTADKVAIVVDGNNNIKAAQIAASINAQTGTSKVKLSADIVDIDGDTIVGYLSGQELSVDSLTSTVVNADEIVLGGDDLEDVVAAFTDVTSSTSGGTVTLTFTQLNGETKTVTFNKAASKVSGSWSGGTFTVSANDNGQNLPLTTAVYKGTGAAFESWDGNIYTGTIVYYPDGQHQGSTGRTFTVDATDRWNAGYDDAKIKVGMPDAAGSGEVMTFKVKVPNDARNGQDERTFTLSKGTPAASGYAVVSLAGTGIVGRISIGDWYSSGWTAAYNSVDGHYPTSRSTSSNYIQIPKPNSTVDGTAQYLNYYVTADSTGAYIKYSSPNGPEVAKADLPSFTIAAPSYTASTSTGQATVTYTLDPDNGTSRTLYISLYGTGSDADGTRALNVGARDNSASGTRESILSRAVSWGSSWSGTTCTITVKLAGTDFSSTTISDGDLVPGNIRNGVNIFGVVGTYKDRYNDVTIYSVALNGATTFSNDKKTAYVPVIATASNGSTGTATLSVVVTESYTAGQNSVNVTRGTWSTSTSSGAASVTYSPSAGTGTSKNLYVVLGTSGSDAAGTRKVLINVRDSTSENYSAVLTRDVGWDTSWSGTTCTVTFKLGSASISQTTVTAPSSITWSKTWSSGHLTVTASPYGSYNQYIVDSGVKQNSDGSTYSSGKYWYVPVYYKDSASSTTSGATGLRVYVNAANVYNDCWATVVNFHLGFYYNQGSGDYFSVKYPTSTVDTSETADFVLSCSGGVAKVSVGSTTCCQKSYASNSAVLRRATTSISSSGASTGPGKLYVYNSTNNSYGLAGPSSNQYWYYSDTGITGGTTVYY